MEPRDEPDTPTSSTLRASCRAFSYLPLPSPERTQQCHTGVYSSHSFQRNSTINYIIK